MRQRGFTLIELLIVVSILSILTIIGMMSWRRQLDKAKDAQRKDHLQKISLAFEEYFSDNGCYPPEGILENCGGEELAPYLDHIPCDPMSGEPYEYIPDTDHPSCYLNFRIMGHLDNDSDPVIAKLGCATSAGCGWEGEPIYNYGVSSKNVTVANPALPESSPPASAAPGPSASPGSLPTVKYFCESERPDNCSSYDPRVLDCTPSYTDSYCGEQRCIGIISNCHPI